MCRCLYSAKGFSIASQNVSLSNNYCLWWSPLMIRRTNLVGLPQHNSSHPLKCSRDTGQRALPVKRSSMSSLAQGGNRRLLQFYTSIMESRGKTPHKILNQKFVFPCVWVLFYPVLVRQEIPKAINEHKKLSWSTWQEKMRNLSRWRKTQLKPHRNPMDEAHMQNKNYRTQEENFSIHDKSADKMNRRTRPSKNCR